MSKINRNQFLYQVVEAVSSLGTKELLIKVDQLVAEITNADSTGIYTLDEKTNSVVLRASKLHFGVIDKLKMRLGEGITGWVAQHGNTVVIEKNAEQDPRFRRIQNLPDDLYQSFLSVPIISGQVIIGVMNVKHKQPHKYSQEQIKLIELVGKLVGKSVEHAMLLEKTKDLQTAISTQKMLIKQKEFSWKLCN